jgi:hypothetical protein
MAKPTQRGRTRKSGIFIVGISSLVLVAAAATVLAVFGWTKIRSVFAHDQVDTHQGKVAVVLAPVNIPAFTRLDVTMFINPRTGTLDIAWVDEKLVKERGLARDPGALRDRVLREDKAAGLAVSETDLFPRGTNASYTAAVEPGYRGVTLDATKIVGLDSLSRNDRFDLVAVIDMKAQGAAKDSSVVMTPEAAAALESARQWKTDRRYIVQNAKIIHAAPKNHGGGQPNTCFVQIRDEESAALDDALTKGVKINCLARSGLPGGDLTPAHDVDDAPATDSIKVISGSNSWRSVVPAGKTEEKPDTDDKSDTDTAEPKK